MGHVTSEVRGWQLMQYAEVELAKGNVDRANANISLANAYLQTIDAEENLGFTAWFSHAAHVGNALTIDFVQQGVGNATAPVDAEVTWDFGDGSTPVITNKALTSNVATLTTAAAHGLVVGQKVFVALTTPDAVFDGVQTVIGTPTATTFTFAKTNANVTSIAAPGTAKIAGLSVFHAFAANGTYLVAMRVAPAAPVTVVVYSRNVAVPYSAAS